MFGVPSTFLEHKEHKIGGGCFAPVKQTTPLAGINDLKILALGTWKLRLFLKSYVTLSLVGKRVKFMCGIVLYLTNCSIDLASALT